ncbi:MAG: hypothetical protein M3N97_14950 [Pseudomonadota bacterium]|nr:hypothetical protein [Pseudomonadota bacterium]
MDSADLPRSNIAVSWPAIIAGAFAACGVSLVLAALGSGLGLASVSPWANRGVSATTFTVAAAIWLLVTQWVSAGMGGYIAGRLRVRWAGTHVHEVFFRDTAHGLITWAVATVLVAVSVSTSIASLVGGGVRTAADAGAQGAAAAVSSAAASDAVPLGTDYGIDKLFRSTGEAPRAGGSDPRVEVAHIAANAIATGSVADTDRAYLATLVAERTGVPQPEAQRRVDDFAATLMEAQAKVKAAADEARKAAATASIYLALSLLVGAFIACVAAALGGRLRDAHA